MIRQRERGGVLVITLAVLAGLVTLLAVSASTQRIDIQAQRNRMEARRARVLIDSAVAHAQAALVLRTSTVASPDDDWYDIGQQGIEEFIVGDASYRIQIVDAGAFINLNTATQEQLQRLGLTDEQIDSLLDWREAGQNPRPQGAKDEYYNNLTVPYNTRLGRLESTDELFLIRGFTPFQVYEPLDPSYASAVQNGGSDEDLPALGDLITVDSFDPNQTQAGAARANINGPQANAAFLIQRGVSPADAVRIKPPGQTRTYGRLGDVFAIGGLSPQTQRAILDEFTVSAATNPIEGRLNLNFASETALNSLPNIAPDIASAIVAQQATGFSRVSELLDVPGVNQTFLQQNADAFTVGSSSFVVRIEARVGRTLKYMQAIIDTSNSNVRIRRLEECPQPDMATRWGWPEAPTTQTTLEDGS